MATTLEAKEAETRARMRQGAMDVVGRLILFTDADVEDNPWDVVDVSQLAELPRYVVADKAMTKGERTTKIDFPYRSGAHYTSRVFARVSSGQSSHIITAMFIKCNHCPFHALHVIVILFA